MQAVDWKALGHEGRGWQCALTLVGYVSPDLTEQHVAALHEHIGARLGPLKIDLEPVLRVDTSPCVYIDDDCDDAVLRRLQLRWREVRASPPLSHARAFHAAHVVTPRNVARLAASPSFDDDDDEDATRACLSVVQRLLARKLGRPRTARAPAPRKKPEVVAHMPQPGAAAAVPVNIEDEGHTPVRSSFAAAAAPLCAQVRAAKDLSGDDVRAAAAATRAYFAAQIVPSVTTEWCASVAALGIFAANVALMQALAIAVDNGHYIHDAGLQSIVAAMRVASTTTPPDAAALRVANAPRSPREPACARAICRSIVGQFSHGLGAHGTHARVLRLEAGDAVPQSACCVATIGLVHLEHWTFCAQNIKVVPTAGVALLVGPIACECAHRSESRRSSPPDLGTGVPFPQLAGEKRVNVQALKNVSVYRLDASHLLHVVLARRQRRLLLARDKSLAAGVCAAAVAQAIRQRLELFASVGNDKILFQVIFETVFPLKRRNARIIESTLENVIEALHHRSSSKLWSAADYDLLASSAVLDTSFRHSYHQWLALFLKNVPSTTIVHAGGEADCHVVTAHSKDNVMFEGRDHDLLTWSMLLKSSCTLARIQIGSTAHDTVIHVSNASTALSKAAWLSAEDKAVLKSHDGLPFLLMGAIIKMDYNDGVNSLGPKRASMLVVDAVNAARKTGKVTIASLIKGLVPAMAKLKGVQPGWQSEIEAATTAMAWMPSFLNAEGNFVYALEGKQRKALVGNNTAPAWLKEHALAVKTWIAKVQQAPAITPAPFTGISLGNAVDAQLLQVRKTWAQALKSSTWAWQDTLHGLMALAQGRNPETNLPYEPFDFASQFPPTDYVLKAKPGAPIDYSRVFKDFQGALNVVGVDLNSITKMLVTYWHKKLDLLRSDSLLPITADLKIIKKYFTRGIFHGVSVAPYSTDKAKNKDVPPSLKARFRALQDILDEYPVAVSKGESQADAKKKRKAVLIDIARVGLNVGNANTDVYTHADAVTVPEKRRHVGMEFRAHVATVLAAVVNQLHLHKQRNMSKRAGNAHKQRQRVHVGPWQEQSGRAVLDYSASHNIARLSSGAWTTQARVYVHVHAAQGLAFKPGGNPCQVDVEPDTAKALEPLDEGALVYIVTARNAGERDFEPTRLPAYEYVAHKYTGKATVLWWDLTLPPLCKIWDFAMYMNAATKTDLNTALLQPLQHALAGGAAQPVGDAPPPQGKKRTRAATKPSSDAASTTAKRAPQADAEPKAQGEIKRGKGGTDSTVQNILAAIEKPGPVHDSWTLAASVANQIVHECPGVCVGGNTYKDLALTWAKRDMVNGIECTVDKTTLGMVKFLFSVSDSNAGATVTTPGVGQATWRARFFALDHAEKTPKCTTAEDLFEWLQNELIISVDIAVKCTIVTGKQRRTFTTSICFQLHDRFDPQGRSTNLTSHTSLFRTYGNRELRTHAAAITAPDVLQLIVNRQYFVCARERCEALYVACKQLNEDGWELVAASADETFGLDCREVVERAMINVEVPVLLWVRCANTNKWLRVPLAEALKRLASAKVTAIDHVYIPALVPFDTAQLNLFRSVAALAQGHRLRFVCKRICIQDVDSNHVDAAYFSSFAQLATRFTPKHDDYLFNNENETWDAYVVGPNGALHAFARSNFTSNVRSRMRDLLDFNGRLTERQPKANDAQKTTTTTTPSPPPRIGRIECVMGHAFSAPRADADTFAERVMVVTSSFSTPASRTLSSSISLKNGLLSQLFVQFLNGTSAVLGKRLTVTFGKSTPCMRTG